MIESKLMRLRSKLRKESATIINQIIKAHINRNENIHKRQNEICVFCGIANNLTKEHILPKWIFWSNPDRTFVNSVNEQSQPYIKTTVPCCSKCNNDYLGYLEKHILWLFEDKSDISELDFTDHNMTNIIRWLEIIEYKFQILEVRRKFRKHKNGDFIKYLADFPISTLVGTGSPSKVISNIRLSLKRITVKSKEKQINSIVIFKTKNEGFYFFHNMNECIFLDLPKYGIALFYFYNRIFDDNQEAYNEAMKIITEFYKE